MKQNEMAIDSTPDKSFPVFSDDSSRTGWNIGKIDERIVYGKHPCTWTYP